MKRKTLFGVWDQQRGGFWLNENHRGRLGFAKQSDADKYISTALIEFTGLRSKRFEANAHEFETKLP